MSELLTKEQIDIERERLQDEDAILEQRRPFLVPERDVYDQVSGAKLSILRSAGASLDSEKLVQVSNEALTTVERKLRIIGCDFIAASYYLLKRNECPADARDFVNILMAMTGGDSELTFVIKDEWIAEFSGLSKSSVVRKRTALKDWQFAKNVCVIQIFEQPRSKENKHFKPNQYRVVFSDHVIRFALELRKLIQSRGTRIPQEVPDGTETERPALWQDMKKEKEPLSFPVTLPLDAIDNAADRVSNDFRQDPIKPREKYQHKNQGSFTKRDPLEAAEARVLYALNDCRKELQMRKGDVNSWWVGFRQRAIRLLTTGEPVEKV
jgi:hypothetical protein